MNKRDLVVRAAAASRGSKNPVSQRQVLRSVNLFFAELLRALASGEVDKIELRGLGTFKSKWWPARRITMPSGDVVDVGPSWTLKIKPHPKWRRIAKGSQND